MQAHGGIGRQPGHAAARALRGRPDPADRRRARRGALTWRSPAARRAATGRTRSRPEAAAGPPAEPARSLRGGVGSDAHERLADRRRRRASARAPPARARGRRRSSGGSAGGPSASHPPTSARNLVHAGAGRLLPRKPRSVRSLAVGLEQVARARRGPRSLVLARARRTAPPAPTGAARRAPPRGGRRRRCRSRRRCRRARPRAATRTTGPRRWLKAASRPRSSSR